MGGSDGSTDPATVKSEGWWRGLPVEGTQEWNLSGLYNYGLRAPCFRSLTQLGFPPTVCLPKQKALFSQTDHSWNARILNSDKPTDLDLRRSCVVWCFHGVITRTKCLLHMSENTKYNISSKSWINKFMTTHDAADPPPPPNCSVGGWSYDILWKNSSISSLLYSPTPVE